MDEAVAFGRWVKQQRAARGLTQAELADLLGYSLETIHKVEAGKRRPSQQLVNLLAEWLDVPPDARAAFQKFARHTADDATAWPDATGEPGGAPSPRRARHLPAALTQLIGRETEIDAVRHHLLRDHVRLLTLYGPPGIGK